MLRSMFSAISGLRGNQVYMDVIGNNIANVNTTAYKAARATFATSLSQVLRPATAPQGARGGINPTQVGLGMSLQSVDTIFTPGDLKPTGRTTDLAIGGSGNGFFILSDGGQHVYTRDGAFDLGTDGSLLNPSNGFHVQGWMADPTTGLIDTTQGLQSIVIPINGQSPAQGTNLATFGGNLDSRADDGTTVITNMEVYDSLGGTHTISVTFTKTGANTWTWAPSEADTDIGGVTTSAGGTITFDTAAGSEGRILSGGTGTVSVAFSAASGIPTPQAVNLDFSTLTQFSMGSEVNMTTQNGCGPGNFLSFGIDKGGLITALYTNGNRATVGQVALAGFTNPGGLLRTTGNAYETSPNSGDPIVAAPGTAGLGDINSCYLESANVDLAQQFTDMIIASRGFQANSRVVTTADEMLQELVNLKR